jgi:hypothetical protein
MSDVYADTISRIRAVKTVRLTKPAKLFRFKPDTPVKTKVPGDPLNY